MKALVSVNGVISESGQAKISVFDRGFLFGDAVYETGAAYQTIPVFLEEHLKRLRNSALKLRIPIPWTDEELTSELKKIIQAFQHPNLYFRIIVSRGVIDHVGLDVLENTQPTLVMITQDLPNFEKTKKNGISLLTSNIIRNSTKAQDPNIKTSNYLNSLLALQDVKNRGGQDAILCNSEGFVSEGTTFSVFGVKEEDIVITPSLDAGILDSITRRHVLNLAKKRFQVKEGLFSVEYFLNCKEIFIASSVREIVSVNSWDGKNFPVEGRVTKILSLLLRNEIQDYLKHFSK